MAAVQQSERRIPVQYARKQVGRRVYGGQSTYIPIKLNGLERLGQSRLPMRDSIRANPHIVPAAQFQPFVGPNIFGPVLVFRPIAGFFAVCGVASEHLGLANVNHATLPSANRSTTPSGQVSTDLASKRTAASAASWPTAAISHSAGWP